MQIGIGIFPLAQPSENSLENDDRDTQDRHFTPPDGIERNIFSPILGASGR
jgi:hypothetical protein